ncbi:MAG: head GIN domain-containing protein [Acidimicrobiia bacterium]|jgi:hypothetical protein
MKPSTVRILTLVSLLTLIATACSDIIGERGSGDVETESREVSGFDGIELAGQGRVEVVFGDSEALVIEAEDNLLPLLTSEVRNGVLVLGTTRNINPTVDIVYAVTAVSLGSVQISGSGDVLAPDVGGDDFEAEVSGSGDIFLTDMEVGDLATDIGGSGTIEVSGVAGAIDVTISGSGNVNAEALSADTATVAISGSGDAVVNVSDELDAEISGSGSIEYLGNPTVVSDVSGSGSIEPR